MFKSIREFIELIKDFIFTLSPPPKFIPNAPTKITSIRYLNGHEVLDTDPERFRRALMTQGISEDQMKYGKYLQGTNEIRISGNKVIEVFEHNAGEPVLYKRNVDFELPISDWPNHKFHFLIPDENGTHKVGGEHPKGVRFKSPYGFSFIASIDGHDPFFQWLKVDRLHVFYPLNVCCLKGLFIDWSDQLNPVILNPEVMTDAWNSETNDGSGVVSFTELTYSSTDHVDVELLIPDSKDLLLCGVPMWYQGLDIPVCPKTGEVMKFVTTINSNRKNASINGETVFGDFLIFMDMGCLYVFWEPTSKIMYLTSQC